jgi:alpha-D-ribose 1-methylphosphonate 5-triphosphate synthase subunit PhnG
MGGTGNPFNMGDITMTRAVIKLDSGEMGHAYLKGRNKEHAQLAALLDALLQTQTYNTPLLEHVIQPLQRLMSQAANERAEEIATSKVDFFTLVRGEDE